MNLPSVVNVRKAELQKRGFDDFEAWKSVSGHVYIGRNMSFYVPGTSQSKWANPFSLKKYSLDDCLRLYEEHVRKNLMSSLHELRGAKELGCWCKPNGCHGDILRKLLAETP